MAGDAAALWDDARAIAPILGADYAREPMPVARGGSTAVARARHDACVPLTHWVCDGLAELEAITVLLGCDRLGELDAAVAYTLAAWRTSGGLGVPRVPKLLPALAAVLTALAGAFEHGASGADAVARVAPIVELIELMRARPALGAVRILDAASPIARVTAQLGGELLAYRHSVERLGAAIDRASGTAGDLVAVALGIAARANQIATIAQAIAAWLDPAPASAAQQRWCSIAPAIESTLAGSLASVRRLVPLPP